MNAFIFPGQGSQFPGMGLDLYCRSALAKQLFEIANEILGFRITDLMFEGTKEDLLKTEVTQPAVFLYSVIASKSLNNNYPEMVAGHSLGEFSGLVVSGSLSFEDGLRLVYKRALSMQKACEAFPGTMAAILGLSATKVEKVCSDIEEMVVVANYNCPDQIVISGTLKGVALACDRLLLAGAKRTLSLNVGGAFHSPLMESAKEALAKAVQSVTFTTPACPIYQNVTTKGEILPEKIKKNVISQLTAPVKWTQSIQNMIIDGANSFTEIGPGTILQGLIRKINRNVIVGHISNNLAKEK